MAVVDFNQINLSPLGKFVIPPPMSEKQVLLKTSEPVSCVAMHGHTLVALNASQSTLLIIDTLAFDPKVPQFTSV